MENSVQLHASAGFPQGNSTQYPFYRMLDGTQSRFWRCEEEKNLLSLPEMEPRLLGRPTRNPVAIPTELSRLIMV
jgi:hypothetical protein